MLLSEERASLFEDPIARDSSVAEIWFIGSRLSASSDR